MMNIKTPIVWLSFLMAEQNRPDPMGGQALIEGVLMRSKTRLGAAVRRKDGSFQTKTEPFEPLNKKYFFLKWPVLRGAVGMVESLMIGMRYLTWSADIAEADEKGQAASDKPKSLKEKITGGFTLSVSLLIGVALFMYLPILVAGAAGQKENAANFNLIAGGFRIALFVGYIWAISLMKDVRRVFEYHGAEHKSILAYEAGEGASAVAARKYTTLHPRCGTSFMLIAGLACVLVFVVIDTLYAHAFGPYATGLQRLLVHLALVPLVSGISFELLKLSDKYRSVPLIGMMIAPGLWLQKLTTREPDDSQLETAVESLKTVL